MWNEMDNNEVKCLKELDIYMDGFKCLYGLIYSCIKHSGLDSFKFNWEADDMDPE